eukprot:6196824-Pleurochrysis_carterae.AAC.2
MRTRKKADKFASDACISSLYALEVSASLAALPMPAPDGAAAGGPHAPLRCSAEATCTTPARGLAC